MSNYCPKGHWEDGMKLPCKQCKIDELTTELAALKAENEGLKRDAMRKNEWNRKIRDLVDDLLAQRGYDPESSARHNLALMNFDAAMVQGEQK